MIVDDFFRSLTSIFKSLVILQQLRQKTKNSVKVVRSHPFRGIMDRGG